MCRVNREAWLRLLSLVDLLVQEGGTEMECRTAGVMRGSYLAGSLSDPIKRLILVST